MMQDLKKLVGSLLILGFEGKSLSASCRNFLEQWDLGGVILFKRNIESLQQVTRLNQEIYEAAQVTPIISVDQEGGRVFRLPEPFTIFPPMAHLGRYCDVQGDGAMAFEVGEALGRELRAVGFNVDWAPILDVHSNPQNPIIGDRAFSSNPETAAKWALKFLAGLQSTGVLGCGKHFPGHGDTHEDSHLTLPRVEKAVTELKKCELIPFQKAVEQQIPMLMTAHVLYSALDTQWPATLSFKILTELLREEMGFQGLIVSDDLFMKGIAAKWPLEEAAERFFRAGGDLLLLCHEETQQRRIASYLVHLAEKDQLFHDILAEKADRMAKLRSQLVSGISSYSVTQFQAAHRALAAKLT